MDQMDYEQGPEGLPASSQVQGKNCASRSSLWARKMDISVSEGQWGGGSLGPHGSFREEQALWKVAVSTFKLEME